MLTSDRVQIVEVRHYVPRLRAGVINQLELRQLGDLVLPEVERVDANAAGIVGCRRAFYWAVDASPFGTRPDWDLDDRVAAHFERDVDAVLERLHKGARAFCLAIDAALRLQVFPGAQAAETLQLGLVSNLPHLRADDDGTPTISPDRDGTPVLMLRAYIAAHEVGRGRTCRCGVGRIEAAS